MAQATRVAKKDKAEVAVGAASFRLREAALILALALAAYLLLSLSSYAPTDPGWSTTGTNDVIANKGGIVGAWLADSLLYGFGFPAYLSPLMLAFMIRSHGFSIEMPPKCTIPSQPATIASTAALSLRSQ